jgi:hypothetical protein
MPGKAELIQHLPDNLLINMPDDLLKDAPGDHLMTSKTTLLP